MIRRSFWLILGAAAGIGAYRRVAALGKRARGRKIAGAARETVRFTRDVREGMDLYMSRPEQAPGSTLSKHTDDDERDGR